MNETFQRLGFYPADILLPQGVDMTRWAVVACDQFTSQPEYWQAVEQTVGDAPSTLRLILPESHLHDPDVDGHIQAINATMERYLDQGLFRTLPGSMIYLRRTQSDGAVRQGLIGMVDLEQYDFTPGSGALIRATEGTVLSRIPPRVRVREGAPIELPHVMLLIDNPDRTVIEPLTQAQMDAVSRALEALAAPEAMERRYGMAGVPPLLFAVGDGNHSLATAKRCYEDLKAVTPPEQWASLPARYALVEVVNNHDDALRFEPIHRVLFDVDPEDFYAFFRTCFPNAYEGQGTGHVMEFLWQDHDVTVTVPDPKLQLAVGTLQGVMDAYLETHPGRVDYIHGEDVTRQFAREPGRLGV